MLLSKIIEHLKCARRTVPSDPDIRSIKYDSRRVASGDLFACIRGDNFDGHDYVDAAIDGGAAAILADTPEKIDSAINVPVVFVPDVREALPTAANVFYNHPSGKMKLVGVTGTKGKTTITYLIASIMRQAGMKTGIIGTIGTLIGDRELPGDRTTPESVDLQGLFNEMVEEGVQGVAMEVSSHALVKHRTDGSEYDVGVFTNLTHDHLDFHHTLEEYLEAKLILFREYPKGSSKPFTAVINADDPRSEKVKEATCGKAITFGVNNPADVSAKNIAATMTGLEFDIEYEGRSFHVSLGMGGKFNVGNSLAAAAAALALGIDEKAIKAGLEAMKSVPGRFECVDCGQEFAVVVDYAHSPDSLENVLKSSRELAKGRLIVVFGCGGNRDSAKRPIMGSMASTWADVCVVTSDNPRGEDPEDIISQIMAGIPPDRKHIVKKVTDRRKAIELALETAQPGDFVLIAGKGHETYQEVKGVKSHFDDREVAAEILTKKGS